MANTVKKPLFPEARYGSYLLIPLKYDRSEFDFAHLEQSLGAPVPIQSTDISESVMQTVNPPQTAHSVFRYVIPQSHLIQIMTGVAFPGAQPALYTYVPNEEPDLSAGLEDFRFHVADSELFLFSTNVAFLCLGFTYPNMAVLRSIYNLGFTVSKSVFCFSAPDGLTPFDPFGNIRSYVCSFGLIPFSKPDAPLFVEAHLFNVGVVRDRFADLDLLRKGAFNLHLMEDLDHLAEDESEEDIHFTYAVKNQPLMSHRFGYCITSQTISYLSAQPELDLIGEMEDQRENILPLILLALYQKYTCLRFRELLSALPPNNREALLKLKLNMMEFQAYGAFPPADMSRWHNIKQTYKYILAASDIPAAVSDLSLAIHILDEREKEFEEQQEKEREEKSNLVLYLISLFGVISIPESILSFVMYFMEGQWFQAILNCTLLGILIAVILILFFRKKKA